MTDNLLSLYLRDLNIELCTVSYYEQQEEEIAGEYCPAFSSIGYILQGTCDITADGRSFTVSAGDIYVLPAHSRQTFRIPPHPPGLPHQKYYCHFYARTHGGDLFERIELPPRLPLPPDAAPAVVHLMEELCRLQDDPGLLAPLRIKALLPELTHRYLALAGEGAIAARGDPRQAPLLDTLAHIEAHLADTLSVRRLAARLFLNENHFIRLFRAFTGFPPGQYILRRRLRRAAELLRQSDLSIAEVARQTGFDSPFYFSNAFKKFYGTAPSTFRVETPETARKP